MSFKDIQKLIDDTDYWDARVESLECNYFSDEITLTFKDSECLITYKFKECYRVVFDHIKTYPKGMPVKDMLYAQRPYFLSEVTVGERHDQGTDFLECKIKMFPLDVDIWCKDVAIYQDFN